MYSPLKEYAAERIIQRLSQSELHIEEVGDSVTLLFSISGWNVLYYSDEPDVLRFQRMWFGMFAGELQVLKFNAFDMDGRRKLKQFFGDSLLTNKDWQHTLKQQHKLFRKVFRPSGGLPVG